MLLPVSEIVEKVVSNEISCLSEWSHKAQARGTIIAPNYELKVDFHVIISIILKKGES